MIDFAERCSAANREVRVETWSEATLAQLESYASVPRSRTVRSWSVVELLTLLDPAVPVTAIMDRLGVKRAVVTYELVRLRRAGFSVPDRPSGGVRSPRTLAIEDDLRAGMTDAAAARRHAVSPQRIGQVRHRAGISVRTKVWTEQERDILIAYQDRPACEVAEMVGRTVRAVDGERSRLIAQGRIKAKIVRPKKRAE